MNVGMISFRAACVTAAFLLYALAGSPTPDHPGGVEAVIGAMLALAAGIAPGLSALRRVEPGAAWLGLLMLYGLSVPVIAGIANGQATGVMLRDVLAFMFVLAPLFLYDTVKDRPGLLSALILFTGVSFAVRALLPVYGFYPAPEELLYLANSPLVLMAALMLLHKVAGDFAAGQAGVVTLGAGLAALLVLAAMLIDVQRAPLMAAAGSFGVMLILLIVKTPRRGVVMAAVFIASAAALWPFVQEIVQEILTKTARVGVNMRIHEAQAVMELVQADLPTALFGAGWGATFPAPSVGGVSVAYTHSFLTYMLLKTGVCGLFLALGVCLQAVKAIIRVAGREPGLALALFWPFIIPVLLYASHKSLDFGVVLLTIFVFAGRVERLQGQSPSCRVLADPVSKEVCVPRQS